MRAIVSISEQGLSTSQIYRKMPMYKYTYIFQLIFAVLISNKRMEYLEYLPRNPGNMQRLNGSLGLTRAIMHRDGVRG